MFKRKAAKKIDPHQIKTDDFNFSLITSYFLGSKKDDVLQTVSEQTSRDLDLQDVFRYIDRTISSVGQQYLYNQVMTIPSTSQRTERLEYMIQVLKKNTGLKEIIMSDVCHPLICGGIANTIALNKKSVLLTGSNMSGKTTFIRTIGVNVLLAQTLNTCFAKTFTMPRMKIHSAIRITDDLLSDKSYYFEEVLTIKQLLEEVKNGTDNLFLLDELFKGTNTTERIASGKAILSYLAQGDNKIFVSTHDREMAEYLHDSYDLYHFTEMIQNNELVFDYKIKTGTLTTTNAIRILELNNFPPEVILEARKISSQILTRKDIT